MRDSKLTFTGFKYPDRVFGPKYQERLTDKPALLNETSTSRLFDYGFKDNKNANKSYSCMSKYTKLGTNLGPQRPFQPVGKFVRYET